MKSNIQPLQLKHLRSGVNFIKEEDSRIYQVVRRCNNLIICRRYIGLYRYTIEHFQPSLIIHKIVE